MNKFNGHIRTTQAFIKVHLGQFFNISEGVRVNPETCVTGIICGQLLPISITALSDVTYL